MRRRAVLLLTLLMTVALLVVASPAWAAEFTVNSTSDPGTDRCDSTECTLREAITAANAAAGADTINFALPGTGSRPISPASPLPPITEAVTINGYSQPGASPNTLATGNDAVLLIQLNGTNAGGGASGLEIQAAGSTIKGLVINSFAGNGVRITGSSATGNKVEGNFIGTNAAGTADLGNGGDGVEVFDAKDNTIGGTAAAARNVISGNDQNGVLITEDSTGNVILGNFIGTDKNGTADLGNSQSGVGISFASDNTVGGTASGARNVISGNDQNGVTIAASSSNGNEVLGNFIGTDVEGTADLGNGDEGVDIFNAPRNTVGGTASGARNVIAHNEGDGVLVTGPAAARNSILSNQIFANDDDAPANGEELGIDLGPDGVTANDEDDPDPGPNNLQNHPEVTTAKPITKRVKGKRRKFTLIAGTLNSTPNTAFTIQLFRNLSGEDEGRTLLTQFPSVTTDADGNASYSIRVRRSRAPVGSAITATATNNSTGDTSEFSKACPVSSLACPTT